MLFCACVENGVLFARYLYESTVLSRYTIVCAYIYADVIIQERLCKMSLYVDIMHGKGFV